MNRTREFRRAAAECVSLARSTTDPGTRASLLIMAQRWFDMATGSGLEQTFHGLVQEFNDQQMSRH